MRIGSERRPHTLPAAPLPALRGKRISAWLRCLPPCLPNPRNRRDTQAYRYVPSAPKLERAATVVQSWFRGEMVRRLIRVRTVAPGAVHVSLHGDRAFLKRIGIRDVGQNGVPRLIDYVALDSGAYRSGVAIPDLDATTNVATLSGAKLAERIGAKARAFAYINGTFFNASQRASACHASNAPIGEVRIPGMAIDCVPISKDYQRDFESRRFDDSSSLTCGPVLSREGRAVFDEKTAKQARFHHLGRPDVPGMLRHANDPHARAALSMPLSGDSPSGNRVRLMVACSGLRGREMDGFTLVEWGRVTARLDRLNPMPSCSLNLDGGRSVNLGVVDRQGRKVVTISELLGGGSLSNLVVLQERECEPCDRLL